MSSLSTATALEGFAEHDQVSSDRTGHFACENIRRKSCYLESTTKDLPVQSLTLMVAKQTVVSPNRNTCFFPDFMFFNHLEKIKKNFFYKFYSTNCMPKPILLYQQ